MSYYRRPGHIYIYIYIHNIIYMTVHCMRYNIIYYVGACELYFKSLYEDYSRELNNTKGTHRRNQRLLQRKKQVFNAKFLENYC